MILNAVKVTQVFFFKVVLEYITIMWVVWVFSSIFEEVSEEVLDFPSSVAALLNHLPKFIYKRIINRTISSCIGEKKKTRKKTNQPQ